MFDSVRKHSKLIQIVLFLLIFPSFVLFGIQGYSHFEGGGNAAAKIDGRTISMEQLDAANRQEIERIQAMLGGRVDIKQIDTPEQKMRTLDGLIRQRLLQLQAAREHLQVTDAQVQQAILQIPQIAALRKPDGSFDLQAYRQLIAAQGMSTAQFEAQMREQLVLQQAIGGIAGNLIGSQALASATAGEQSQQRVVRIARFDPADYTAQVRASTEQVQAFYKANPALFRTPEKASIQYVVLDAAALQKPVTEAEARAYYDAHLAQYTTPQERRASHILITVPADATPAQQAAAKAKAEAIAKQVRADPSQFAALARKDSQDPGSAANGGDLGWFTRDAMVKPFADAVFDAKKVGEILGPVRSQFGWHIIELTGIKPGKQQTFAEVKAQIEALLARQAAQKALSAASDTFTNAVYEHPDTFQPVVDKLHLTVQTANDITRTPVAAPPGSSNPLASQTFLDAVFSENSLRNRHNIPAVQIAPGVWASARVTAYQPAQIPPFDQVADKARALYVQQQAAQLAAKAGAQAMADPAKLNFGPAITLRRDQPTPDVPAAIVARAFAMSSAKLPALAGVDLGDQGYAVVQLDQVITPTPTPEQIRAALAASEQMWTEAVANAYIETLKKRFDVQVFYKPGRATAAG